MTRRDLEERLDALEEDVSDDENDGSDTLAEAIKKVYWERRDGDGDRERTTREKVDRAVRDDE